MSLCGAWRCRLTPEPQTRPRPDLVEGRSHTRPCFDKISMESASGPHTSAVLSLSKDHTRPCLAGAARSWS